MDATRSLSLALMIVAPFIMATEITDYSLEETLIEDHPRPQHTEEHLEEWDHSQEELDDPLDWSRRKRAIDSPGEAMETAEQVIFNPFTHHRQVSQDQVRRELPRVTDQQGAASVPQYVFRGTPFGAVFVKHQIEANPPHRQR